MLEPGSIIDKYEILAPIAGGGMGVVYRARHRIIGKEVAIKVLLPNLALNEKVQHRFQQEAYVQSELEHPNIVDVRDFIEERGTLAIVMELIQGPSLEDVLAKERTGAWSSEQALEVMQPVIDAVAMAHQRGVVHRDLKPGNILLDRSGGESGLGVPKVTDFGLAKILSSEVGMTRTGARMGTVPYMAPEQFRGVSEIDARADVFALGMLLWRMLAGYLPVEPESMDAVYGFYKGEAPLRSVSDLASDIPSELASAIDTALALDPADRPADAGALAVVLGGSTPVRHSAVRTTIPATTSPASRQSRSSAASASEPEDVVEAATPRSVPFPLLVAGVLGVVVLIVALTSVLDGGDEPDPGADRGADVGHSNPVGQTDRARGVAESRRARNACGGEGALAELPNEPCGVCDTGTWVCNGPEAVICRGDRGAAASNACGGCGRLRHRLGERCNDDPDIVRVCDGPNSTRCEEIYHYD